MSGSRGPRYRAAVVGALALIASTTQVDAQARAPLPQVCQVPPRVAERVGAEMTPRLQALTLQRAGTVSKIASFESACRSVPETDAARLARCRATQAEVEASIVSYLQQHRQATADLAAAVGRADRENTVRLAALDVRIADTRAKLRAFDDRLRGFGQAIETRMGEQKAQELRMRMKGLEVLANFLTMGMLRRQEAALAADARTLEYMKANFTGRPVRLGIGVTNDRLRSLKRWTVHTNGQARFTYVVSPRMTDIDVLRAIQEFGTVLNTIEALTAQVDDDGSTEATLKVAATAMKLLVKDPISGLVIDMFELNIQLFDTLLTDISTEARIDELNQLGTEQLKWLNVLTQQYRRQIDERTSLRRERRDPAIAASVAGCPG